MSAPKTDRFFDVIEPAVNRNCLLARNGFKPYARCDHCDLTAQSCMGMQSTGSIFVISFLAALFLFIDDPFWIKVNIILVVGMLFWLGYRIMLHTDMLADTSEKNRQLSEQLGLYNLSLETEVNRRTFQLRKMATQDGLTGLMNRQAFEQVLTKMMQQTSEETPGHVLCFIDLDQFKIVNDTCGHVAGDELLRQIAMLLKEGMGEHDIVARLGGDEFAIIYADATPESAEKQAQRLLQRIGAFRFLWEGKMFRIGASIGMVAVEKGCCTLSVLLARADTACYAAKEQGRNRIHIATEDDSVIRLRHEQMQWIGRIELALEEERFALFVQPIVALSDPGAVVHYEVLLRMRSFENKLLAPMAFIPAAERFGKMVDMDRWVIETLFASFYDVRRQLRKNVRFNINLSGLSLNDETMAGFIQECFEQYAVPYEAITFEVTETAAIGNIKSAKAFIEHFRLLGCRFALDDFGCGLSSFAYLQNLPVDYLKIDGSFVMDIDSNEVNLAMVDAINKIGHVMGIKTVCECVENASVMETLISIGVDFVQGYHVGRPQPLNALHGI
ncbi:EAL domain-containing protein [Sulfurimonas sp. HSL-1656]|uniref:EAL domain-containing protein n=1 Tax=Thiomicrolovo subterrani TaxID=3131934 RepID=UPI0031F7E4EF